MSATQRKFWGWLFIALSILGLLAPERRIFGGLPPHAKEGCVIGIIGGIAMLWLARRSDD